MLSLKTEMADYLRDFEFAQPIYDLAFGLDVLRYYKGLSDGSYRSTSLWLAAYRLDGYSTSVKRMLLGQKSRLPDIIPSDRIIRYLNEIDKTSTLAELVSIRNKIGEAPFRLRKIAGMGPATIASYLKASDRKRRELREGFLPSIRFKQTDVEEVAEGSDVTIWQKAHVYPPAYRLLNQLYSGLKGSIRSSRMDLPTDEFVRGNLKVTIGVKDVRRVIPTIVQIARKCPGFVLATATRRQVKVQHMLGFSIEVNIEKSANETSSGTKSSLPVLEYLKDPRLPKWIQSDLHMHSTWSDGVATVLGMANACQQMGLQYAAITEHSRSRKAQNGLHAHELVRHISFTKRLNGMLTNFRLVPGIEVDILDDGRLDLPSQLLSGLGWVVGSVHSSWTNSAQQNSNRLIRAIETGVINGIGHPTARLIGKPGVPNYLRPAPQLDWPSIFQACAKHKVALEINCFPARLDLNRELAKSAISAGCYVYIASDAHATNHLPLLSHGGAIIKGFPKEQVVNSFAYDDFLGFIQHRKDTIGKHRSAVTSNIQGTLFDYEKPKLGTTVRVQASVANMPLCPNGPSAIGLDLTASSNKKTGVALLTRLTVKTKSLATDAEILEFIRTNRPAVVSIDSPLGLPGGGKHVSKDAGIVRTAERDLASIGIHAYPALIPSMAPLTLRGIRLARRIRKEIPSTEVIESYPGAAQDLLSIPRKQQSLEELREGLRNLGLSGMGLDSQSHDEIDAITSAIVGRLYKCGQTIALGTKEEAFLYVPRFTRLVLESPLVIFLSGPTSAGKSTLSLYLAAYYDAQVIRTRDIIEEILVKNQISAVRNNKSFARYIGKSQSEIPRAVLRDFGVLIRDEYEQRPLVERLTQQIATEKQRIVVIDAARTDKEIESLKGLKMGTVVHWHVDASFDTRRERFLGRGKNPSDRTTREFESYLRIDSSSVTLSRIADGILHNNASLEQYHALIDERLFGCLELISGNSVYTRRSLL